MPWMLEGDGFCILDESTFMFEMYADVGMRYIPGLYKISNPFLMNSQFAALQSSEQRVRKRKAQDYLETNEENLVNQKIGLIQSLITERSFFEHVSSSNNNEEARLAARSVISSITKYGPMMDNISLSDEDYISVPASSGLYKNFNDRAIQITANIGESLGKYLIPARSSFIFGDVSVVNDIEDKFDLISMDPPWINKSAKRKKCYQTDDSTLESLELGTLLADGGIAIIWITNRNCLIDAVDTMIEKWGLKRIAIWTWLKITTAGEPVYPTTQGYHKKTYENFIIASREDRPDIPRTRLITSVPMSVHSHKPPATMLAKCLNHSFTRHLELFARNLLPDTLSIGYEPLLLQKVDIFYKDLLVNSEKQ